MPVSKNNSGLTVAKAFLETLTDQHKEGEEEQENLDSEEKDDGDGKSRVSEDVTGLPLKYNNQIIVLCLE